MVSSLPTPKSGSSLAGRMLALMVSLGAGIFFWRSPALYPLKLLAVMVHESGHALAAGLLGGTVQKVVLAPDESGLCLSSIPSSFWAEVLVSSAGYLGSVVAGCLLVLVAVRLDHPRWVLGALALWLFTMALLYAGNLFTFGFCMAMAVGLAAGARFLRGWLAETVDLFISSFIALYAVFDLRDDLWSGAVREQSDAGILARATHLPALLWATLWSAFAVLVVAAGLGFLWRTARSNRVLQAAGTRAKSISALR